MNRLATVKHAFDWLLFHSLLGPVRGGIDPEQQASITYFEASDAPAWDGSRRKGQRVCAPGRADHPLTRAREETR